jgi:diguanylate cyclase (GGDEF)-like protein/PAS domain S-box-containing protein
MFGFNLTSNPMIPDRFHTLLLNVIYAAAYFVGGYAGILLAVEPSNASPVWPAAGIALAGMLLNDSKVLPGIFVGALAVQSLSFFSAADFSALLHSLLLGVISSLGSCLQALLAVALIKHYVGKHDPLIEDKKIVRFLLIGGPVSCVVSASIGIAVLYLTQVLDAGDIPVAWGVWWVGDTIGVVIFTPMVMLFAAKPDNFWKPRRRFIAYPLLLLFITVIAVFKFSQLFEQDRISDNFQRQANRVHSSLRHVIHSHLETNQILKAYFDSQPLVSLDSFQRFTQPVFSRHKSIQALEWIPRVNAAQRDLFEQDGLIIRERNRENQLIPATRRDQYYPIFYVEPLLGNARALGFDINSSPDVSFILGRVIETGMTQATGGIQLVQDSDSFRGIVMYSPVYAKHVPLVTVEQKQRHFQGFVATVFRIEDVVTEALGLNKDVAIEVNISENGQLLFDSDYKKAGKNFNFIELEQNNKIAFAGRNWQIAYRPAQSFYSSQQSWSTWWVLCGGLLLTGLTGMGLLLLTGRAARVEELVRIKTRDLEYVNKHLNQEMAKRHQLQLEQVSRNNVLELVAGNATLSQVLQQIAEGVERQHHDMLCSILLLDQNRQCLQNGASPSLPDYYLAAIEGLSCSDSIESLAAALVSKQTVVVEDIWQHPGWQDFSDLAVKARLRACWSEPIMSSGNLVLGAFVIYYQQPRLPVQDDLHFIQRMARLAAIAIQRKYQESELRIAATTFQSHEAIVVTETDGTILRVNDAFSSITGYGEEEAIGRTPKLLSSGFHDMRFYRAMFRKLKKDGRWQGEIWNRRKNGEVYPEWLTVTAVKNEQHDVTHYVAIFSDITDQKEAEKEIHDLAFYDPLTGLPNRRLLMDRLQHEIISARRHQRFGALLFLDLDHFKRLNDSLGHQVGDELLKEVAQRIKLLLREEDTACRMGGDEFIVMTSGQSDSLQKATDLAASLAERVRMAINQPFILQGSAHHFSTSIGISIYPQAADHPEEAIQQADTAMYRAKENGRNDICFFETSMQELADQRLILEKEMRLALEKEHFVLFYQPQVDRLGNLVSVEALIRWLHPEKGMISPAEFIPVAEETQLIVPVGHWVLHEACRQIKQWDMENFHVGHVAVNVSSRQFRHADFVAQVKNALEENEVSAERLMIELTEGIVIDNIDDTIAKMHALKQMGVDVSIDDFGTGYSSLTYLKKLPLSQLKIDQSFVRDIVSDTNDAVIVETIINMAKNLGLNVIAEGVETQQQSDFLLTHGCESFQGFYYGRPAKASELGEQYKKPN